MILEEIRLHHFRNYEEIRLVPHPRINLIFGHNGAGKTNLLEAIHYCALGKSHRESADRNVIRRGSDFSTCRVLVRRNTGRIRIDFQLFAEEAKKKQIEIDGKRIHRFSELMGSLQCVIFSPEDLRLIKEGPSLRRKYLDMMISQYSADYFVALQQYRAAMDQRNAAIRSQREGNRISPWVMDEFERIMGTAAGVIMRGREAATARVEAHGADIYRDISGREQEQLRIVYRPSLTEGEYDPEKIAGQFAENREQDLRNGMTTIGPHRDQMEMTLQKIGIRNFASQGQMRTAALSLKLAQMKIMEEASGEKPVLLLDDVMSELDRSRRERLLALVEGYQTFVTCTDEDDLLSHHAQRTYRVRAAEEGAALEETNRGPAVEEETLREPDFS